MRTDVKEKWVKALRSKKYRQGGGYLHQNDSYCCLGVLCEIAVEEGIIKRKELDDYNPIEGAVYEYGIAYYDSGIYTLPKSVMEWAGLTSTSPRVVKEGQMRDLPALNDSGNYTFDDIADLIEESL